ncbi:hypothetical protein [Pandoraea sp. NPDC087047]|uniref:hypothetical protein n=1 Tax=Pandoraea sp. NPDC087047 TaxID=3364390 RepID=UPI00380480CA
MTRSFCNVALTGNPISHQIDHANKSAADQTSAASPHLSAGAHSAGDTDDHVRHRARQRAVIS